MSDKQVDCRITLLLANVYVRITELLVFAD